MAEIRFPAEWLDLVQEGQLDPVEFVLLCAVLERDWTAHGKGKGYIRGYNKLAERINKSRRQTIRLCKQLEEKGYLIILSQGNTNTLLVNWSNLPGDIGVTSINKNGDIHDTRVVTSVTLGSDIHDTSSGDIHDTQKYLRNKFIKEIDKEKKSPASPQVVGKFAGIGKTVRPQMNKDESELKKLERQRERLLMELRAEKDKSLPNFTVTGSIERAIEDIDRRLAEIKTKMAQ